MAAPAIDRFFKKVMPVTESGCWLWLGAISSGGHGSFGVTHSNIMLAHRFSYEFHKGPIPEGLTLDHLCRVRSCVNPDHLEPVSLKENILRGMGPTAVNSRKTHCKNGHLFDDANTYINAGSGGRQCRACRRLFYSPISYQRLKQKQVRK